jgi:hypothetical protein
MMVVVHACAGDPDVRETSIWRHSVKSPMTEGVRFLPALRAVSDPKVKQEALY